MGVTTRVRLFAISFLLLMAKKDRVYPERRRRASIPNAKPNSNKIIHELLTINI
jgi:hypothetical protein